MNLPSISIVDILQELRFNLGYSLASVISQRNKDEKTASMEFYKSCLFGVRALIILKLKKFAFTYDEIYNFSKKIDLKEYKELVEIAYNIRIGQNNYQEMDLFKNISFLNKFIEPKLIEIFRKDPKKILI